MAAAHSANLVPITRAFLKTWCESLSPPPVPQELSEVLQEINVAINEVATSEPGSGLKSRLMRESPKKIDENLFRCREQCELVLEIADSPAGKSWLGSSAEFPQRIKDIFERVEEFQKNNNERVRKLIADFMPNDFRATMLAYQHERGEKQKLAEIQKLREKGGTIVDKYNMLWAQQLARREKLVALGQASGVWKAVVQLVAGVPAVLLDFVKTINDDQGPVEEIRQVCAPPLYEIRALLNSVHVLTAIGVQTRNQSALPLLIKATVILDSFTTTYLAFLNHVFTNAPWFVTASELAARSAGGGAASDYIKVSVDAGSRHEVSVSATVACTIGWEFRVESRDIAFSVIAPSGEVAVASQRFQASPNPIKDQLSVTKPGDYKLVWDNSYSYMNGKSIEYRTFVLAE